MTLFIDIMLYNDRINDIGQLVWKLQSIKLTALALHHINDTVTYYASISTAKVVLICVLASSGVISS
jgi:hypothetical protein